MSLRKTYHHTDLRETLLRKTEEILREKGIAGLSMRECARRAGVSWSAPIHHFGDKTGLITAFAIEGFGRLKAQMEQRRDAEQDPRLRMHAVGLGYIEFALENPEHFRIMFRSEWLDAENLEYVAAHTSTEAVLTDALNALDAIRGEHDDEIRDRSLLAWSVVHGFTSLCLEGAIDFDSATALDTATRILDLLRPALLGPTAQ